MAATANQTRIMDMVRINVPGAVDGTILKEFFLTAEEFFRESNAWYEDIVVAVTPTTDSYITNPAAYTYTLTPAKGEIVRLLSAWDAQGYVIGAVMPTLGKAVLVNSPNTAQNYTFRVALTCSETLDANNFPDVPDTLVGRYINGIADGVMSRLMFQPAKPYSNPAMGQARRASFNKARNRAKVATIRQNVYRSQAWQFPQSFAVPRTHGF